MFVVENYYTGQLDRLIRYVVGPLPNLRRVLKYNGKPCPDELLKGKRFAFIKGVPQMMGTPFQFRQHGESGGWVSELLPNFSKCLDDVTIIRSMTTERLKIALESCR